MVFDGVQLRCGCIFISALAATISSDGTAMCRSTIMWWMVNGSGSLGTYSPGGFWSRTAPRSNNVWSSLR